MTTNTSKLTLQAITDMARSVQTYVSGQLYFSGLHDTPDGYQDGYFLKSSTTGIEYSQVVENVTELPAEIIDGQLLSLECELYVGCNGEWKNLGSPAVPEIDTLPGCVTGLLEAVEYNAYRQTFLANNISDNFANGFLGNDNISDSIHDVCLFSDNSRSEVKIDETTYKWGMFAGTQTVNITATPGTISDIDRAIQFSHWAGDGAVFGDANRSQTTLVVDKGLSVTGYFSEILYPALYEVGITEIDTLIQANLADVTSYDYDYLVDQAGLHAADIESVDVITYFTTASNGTVTSYEDLVYHAADIESVDVITYFTTASNGTTSTYDVWSSTSMTTNNLSAASEYSVGDESYETDVVPVIHSEFALRLP